ncbi:MAG: hypothetical protein AAGJ29_12325 [Pseudomonadota bacterium]
MSVKSHPKLQNEPSPKAESCPVEALMREHAGLYRAKALADQQRQEPEIEENPLIADWSPDYLWKIMVSRIGAIEEMARIEQATSQAGVIYQLLVARSIFPVTSVPDSLWKGEPVTEREAKDREDYVNCLMDSALSFLLIDNQDPDLQLLLKSMGSESPFSPAEAVRNLLDAARKDASAFQMVG